MSTDAAGMAASGEGKRDYVRQIFSEIAPRYDLLNHLLSFNIDKRWRNRALAQLGWDSKPAGVFLDLCSGTMDVGAALVAIRGFTGTVIGADFAVPMLRHGAGKAPANRLVPVGADALALPVRSQSLDGAIVAFGIRNVADLGAGLREVRRVLRPGARFVILEFSTPRSALVRTAYHAYFHNLLPLVGRIISGHSSAYRYLPKSVAHFPTEERLAAEMKAAGFHDVRFQRLTFGVAAIHSGTVPKLVDASNDDNAII